MPKKEIRCSGCNKLLMKDSEIKCSRCKEIVVVGNVCEYYTVCSHRHERKRLGSIRNLLKTLPISMKESLRLSNCSRPE